MEITKRKKVNAKLLNRPVRKVSAGLLLFLYATANTGIAAGIIPPVTYRQGYFAVGGENFSQIEITGAVQDEKGEGLPGVNILVKNTQTGTTTDAGGRYKIGVPSESAVLIFSFVGYVSQEIRVGSQKVLNITLAPDQKSLDEVVVVGYGTQKKSDLTGAIERVDMTKKAIAANVDFTQALQGIVPGLNVGSPARAGEVGAMSIRGQTSLSASDAPLIVLDGIIYNGSTADINLNDIESIDILKDASASAVYGSRSANGVLIITTKKGKTGTPSLSFNSYYGFQGISTTKRTQVMNGDQYAARMVDYYYQQGLYSWYKTMPTSATERPVRADISSPDVLAASLRSEEEKNNFLSGKRIDWIKSVLQSAPIQNHSFNLSGKANNTQYFLSASFTDQKGVLINDRFKRSTIRTNIENSLNSWLRLGINASYSRLDYSGVEASMKDALAASPLANMYDDQGQYPIVLANETYQGHPLNRTLINNMDVSDNLFSIFTAKVNIPSVEGLEYELNYSGNFNISKINNFYPVTVQEGQAGNGMANKIHDESRGGLLNSILSYSRKFSPAHKLNATFLFSSESRSGEISELKSSNFENDRLGYHAMETGTVHQVASGAWEEKSVSYMGRINYSLSDRYLMTATLRRDGFSGFGANQKFANFPSLSFAWVVSEESFLKGVDAINFLKIRLSYGKNGNQGIGRYASQAKISSTSYVFGSATFTGNYASSLGNQDLGWESTKSFNLGLDFDITKNRTISGHVDLYKARTTDVLVERSIPQTTGYSSVWANIGEVKNKGVELSLTTRNVSMPKFSWESRFAFSMNRNQISKLYEGVTRDISNGWFVGKSIGAQYDYTITGVWQEKDLFEGNIHSGFYPGQFRFKDLDNDNRIGPDNDRSVIGYSAPNYRFGINNTLTHRSWTLSFFFNSIQGGNGYYIGNQYDEGNRRYNPIIAGGSDYAYRKNRTTIRPYWTPESSVNNAPGMFYAPPLNHGVYEDRSFVRLQDVSLSYDFDPQWTRKWGIHGFQGYVSGKNLYTWTKWSGWDPEVYNYGEVPVMRSFIVGMKFSI